MKVSASLACAADQGPASYGWRGNSFIGGDVRGRRLDFEFRVFTSGSGWLDTQIIWERGTPAVAFGPTGSGAHAAVEYVEVDSVISAARILERAIHRFCG